MYSMKLINQDLIHLREYFKLWFTPEMKSNHRKYTKWLFESPPGQLLQAQVPEAPVTS